MRRYILAVCCLTLFACIIPLSATAAAIDHIDIVVDCPADKAWLGSYTNTGAYYGAYGTGPGSYGVDRGDATRFYVDVLFTKVSTGGWQLTVSIKSGSEVLKTSSTTAENGSLAYRWSAEAEPVPGFPPAAVALGIAMALAPLIVIRRRRTSS
jgi:hypothetical protein